MNLWKSTKEENMNTPKVVNAEKIRKELRKFLETTFYIDPNRETLNDTDSFQDKGIIDSTGILEVVSYIQKHFKIIVEENELLAENLDSIENIVRYVCRKKTKTS